MPTSFSDAEQKMTAFFQTNAPSDLKVAYDNLDETAIREDRTLDNWARFTLLDSGTEQIGMGTTVPRSRVNGFTVVQVFGKTNRWVKEVLDLADTVAGIFRGVQHDGVTYRSPDVEKVGPTGGWYQVNVVVPFWWDLDA